MIYDLVKKSRSYRNFEGDCEISRDTLVELVKIARVCPSAANKQPVKFYLSCDAETNAVIFPTIKWAASLKDIKVPFPGNEPTAYIVLCVDTSIVSNVNSCGVDIGIMGQSMMLGAVEMGLNGCFIAAFNAQVVKDELGLDDNLEPRLLMALGKAKENVEIVPVKEDGDITYYRDGMTNYVPKRSLDELIIK